MIAVEIVFTAVDVPRPHSITVHPVVVEVVDEICEVVFGNVGAIRELIGRVKDELAGKGLVQGGQDLVACAGVSMCKGLVVESPDRAELARISHTGCDEVLVGAMLTFENNPVLFASLRLEINVEVCRAVEFAFV